MITLQLSTIIIVQSLMNQENLGLVIEAVQTFIELKQQNLIILAWIALQKNNKQRRNIKTTKQKHHSEHFKINFDNTQSPYPNYQKWSYLGRSQVSNSSPINNKYKNLATDFYNMNLNEKMFQTFNKKGGVNNNFFQDNEADHYRSVHRDQPSEEQLDDDLLDSDQFEDIVLDRLSKLEENINQMMKEKKIKEDLRGYVGAPIQPHRPEYHFEEQAFTKNYDQYRERSDIGPSRPVHDKANGNYQYWQTSPVRKRRPDTVYNLKYISLPNNRSPVNIVKIKQLIDTSNKDQPQKSKGGKQSKSNSSYDSYSHNTQEKNKYGNHQYAGGTDSRPEERASTSLYLDRYGFMKTAHSPNQIQFVPKKLEIQTVIEPGNRFIRSSRNSRTTANAHDQYLPKQPQTKYIGNMKKPGELLSREYSYFSERSLKGNNKSALH